MVETSNALGIKRNEEKMFQQSNGITVICSNWVGSPQESSGLLKGNVQAGHALLADMHTVQHRDFWISVEATQN